MKRKTRHTGFSVYPTTAASIRSLASHFGSVGRAIQTAVEILYRDARGDSGAGVPPRLHSTEAFASVEEKQQDLKVPLSFSILPRTERLIEWLADPKRYKDRNIVIDVCEGMLKNLYDDHYFNHMTAAERQAEDRVARKQRKD